MSKWEENNARVITEFRENGGVVGGHYENWPMLILHTTGAKSGREHLSPLVYLPDDDRMVVIASAGAQPRHPDWYHNIVANPHVTVEVGTEIMQATAREVFDHERDDLYARQAEKFTFFAGYERKAPRKIPVIVLDPDATWQPNEIDGPPRDQRGSRCRSSSR